MNNWSELNHLQLGRYGEYFAKMEFTKAGFDVYTSEVDDKGIDFVVRKNENEYFDIQVKSVRNYNYIFMRKDKFPLRKNLLVALVLFKENKEPTLLLVPSLDWKELKHHFLVENNYEHAQSEPEWGIRMSAKGIDEFINLYVFEKQVGNLL